MQRQFLVSLLVCLCVFSSVSSFAQSQAAASDADLDKMIETMRADFRADKVAIVTELMKFKGAEAEKFWPVYRKYDLELTTLNDERLRIVKEYVDNFATLTDEQAKSLVERMLNWETRRTQLRKNYFSQFAKATSAVTAAKFMQIEHRLNLLVDLAVASEVPGLFIKTADAGKQ
jgi:hypothetical protein